MHPSTSTPSCDHANIIEENARLKDELAKVSQTSPKGEKTLVDQVLKEQKPHNREGGSWLCCQGKEEEEQEQEEGQACSSKEE